MEYQLYISQRFNPLRNQRTKSLFCVSNKLRRCVMELITVTEYYGNSFVSERLAYFISPGKLEYLPAKEELREGVGFNESAEN